MDYLLFIIEAVVDFVKQRRKRRKLHGKKQEK